MDASLDPTTLPTHVGIIMDGNGRWAKSRNLARTDGHAAGEEALYDVVLGALEIGLPWLTVFAFSTENWRRPIEEVQFLMNFNESILMKRRDDLHQRGVRVRIAGRPDNRIPRSVRRKMDETVEMTKNNTKLNFTVAFNYGGQAEVVDAVKAYNEDGNDIKKLDEAAISRYLYVPEMPATDLVIRTSGEYRTSNFLLWESPYAEWYFTDTLWPDFRRRDLVEAIAGYQQRDRRFGGVDST